MTVLDLTTPLGELVQPDRSNREYKSRCVVWPMARMECCGQPDVHLADAFIRFSCGCAFTYCRRALVTIYGPVRLTHGMCPRHDNGLKAIHEGYWI